MQHMFSRVELTNAARLTVIALLLTVAGWGQSLLSVQAKGNQRWPGDEVDKLYLSACQALQMEFGDGRLVRPQITLILGADKDEAVVAKGEIRLVKWDPYRFAEGVVILGFEDLMSTHERLLVAKRAVNLADSTMEVKTSRK